jgi:hypothetical protein
MTYILIMVLTFTYDRGGGVSASQGTYGTLEACELAPGRRTRRYRVEEG